MKKYPSIVIVGPGFIRTRRMASARVQQSRAKTDLHAHVSCN